MWVETGEISTKKKTDMGGNGGIFYQNKIRIWMDMDLAERSGVEWVS